MAIVNFDGKSSVTATKDDTVFITADATTFTSVADTPSGVQITFGAATLTVSGATFTNNGLPNVFVQGGQFAYLNTVNTNGTGSGSTLGIALDSATTLTAEGTLATSTTGLYGGFTRTDAVDASVENLSIGGKGAFLAYTGLGADIIAQTATKAFDSSSTVNIFAGGGGDNVTFNEQNVGASIFVGAGGGEDTVSVVNSGATTIFGGTDASDSADTITFDPISSGAGGNSQIFGNGGADIITVGGNVQGGLDSTSVSNIFGGAGNDSVTATGTGARLTTYGGEGQDTITVVANGGNTFIAGGLQGTTQDGDLGDNITVSGSKGNLLVYGNLGNDTITAANLGDSTNISIYGGKDDDAIVQSNASAVGKSTISIYGGEGLDTITAVNNGGSLAVYGGVQGTDSNDVADTISISDGNTGSTFVYGNFGNDSINIGAVGVDSATKLTAFGGQGDDTFNVAKQTDTTPAGTINAGSKQQIVLFGNEGKDTFIINGGANSTGTNISIEQFNSTAGVNDTLSLVTGGAVATLAQASANATGTLQQALDAAANAAGAAGNAGGVVFQGNTYIVISDGTAGFSASADQAIKLTGTTDLAGIAAATTVA